MQVRSRGPCRQQKPAALQDCITGFGATAPPFIDYLQDILRRYPDGGQILKELIQNADDGKATEVVFIHDERSYGTESLWTDNLGEYQGPALYAYNNAAFTEDDWEGIQMAGRSVKRNDPNKVGRFGIGFNSVYHITDVPSIFSSEHLGFMDPQEKIFGERKGGFLWSLDDAEHQEALMTMHDQFQPFRDIVSLVSGQEWSKVIMEDQHFDGTIFRFPLRKEASDISDNLYDSDKVVELFDSFIADADLSLLFLKNVTSVSLKHIDVHGNVNPRLEVKSSVCTDVVLESEDDSIIEDNRRQIKWQEEDQKHDEHAVWNELLIKEVLPQAYVMIIQDAIRLAQESRLPVSSVYNLWPDISQTKHKEKWYVVALDVLHHLFRQNVAVLSLAKDEKQFITPSEAVFPCNGPTSPDILAAIKTTLVSCGENLVTLPGSVARALKEAYPHFNTLKHVTPTFVRDVLRKIDVHSISKDNKLCLLEYVLSDEKYSELKGLQLLPLSDGSFRSFTDKEEDTALIDSKEFPRALLPCCKHLFIPDDLSPACSFHLKELAGKNLFKVINIAVDQVTEYTRRYLPQDWKQMRAGLVTWDIRNSQHPPLSWLQDFWKFLNTHCKELSNCVGMPLIPVSPLSLSQSVSLARLEQNTTLIFQKSKQINLPEEIAQLVNKVGGTAVTGNEWLKHEDLDSYVLCPSPRSVMKVLCATEADRRLLQLLKVNLLDTADAANLLIECIESGVCRKEDTEKIMAWILQHEFFPPPLYTQTPQMCQGLTDLGLLNKEADVPPEHLLHAATLIDKLHADSQTEALSRAQVLLKMLDTNDLLSKFSPEQLCHLKMLKWVPCAVPGNDKKHCNDKSQTSSFFCPDEIRVCISVNEDIVGHVMPLVGKLSDRVSSQLGFKRLPPAEKVIENLCVLTSKAQEMPDPDTNVDFKRKLHSIYKHMQDHISEFSTIVNTDTPWLWSHNQFVSPQDLVLDYPRNLDLSCYIGKVPKEFLPYKELLLEFGLKTQLSDQEIVGILYSIQQTIEGRQQPLASSPEVKVSIEIFNWLWREKKTFQDDFPVPVLIRGEQHTLKPLSTAVFCDVSKNGLKELKNSQEDIYVVHEEIPKAAAEWFNIRFLSTYILDPELVGIEQYGQSEPITTRIKNILKEYDEESDIFKELIQNAEDAGAEACKFLVDFRVHKDAPESLIDPDMTLCQGPCLWAFNNEQFTAEDWKNIVRVGAASKENKVEKIGKFGLGFNTVYHVTDVPSILSGSSLLILDPNVTHLKKHIKHKTNPGIKLDLSQQHLFHWFPGQFGPYECIFDCNFSRKSPPEPYPGTLIKLPFRTEEEALKEKVSDTFKPLVDALYSAIAQHSIGLELFSDGEHWCSMNNAIFLHENIEEDKDISALAVQVCKKHVKAPNHVITLPLWLRNSLKQSGLEKVLQNRTWNWDGFYQEVVFNNLGTMDPKSRDALVLHAIDLNIKEIDKLLVCYPCIPTKSGQLQHIRKLVDPSGKVACLFETEEGRLLGGTENDFCSPKRIERLLELGMAKDHLPLDDITEIAGTIPKTWSTDKKKAYRHLNCLLELMNNHMDDEDSLHWETLRMTEFLPAFPPAMYEPKEKTTGDFMIPNQHGVLQPASELFYNDSPWMPVTSGVTLCHEKISRVMARHFGIKTTRHHTLQNHVVENISPFAFQFEQQEQLTVRIKNIISAYPSKKDILKELIQNADDAEATEIHFVWDRRQHGKERTFGKKWNQLQGPALCVFNNKVFSDADLAGIQRLGEGGKHSSPGKIGKYGVGFNSVYHLTDCPSILTGDEILCISDPNQKYIESYSDKPPTGTGYKLPETFKNMYIDVYKSFLPDKFPLKEGTMFRLPLRMGNMANSSKISQQGVTDHDMKELCSALSEDPEGLILFLKNICKIEVHEISEHSGELKTIFMVEKIVCPRLKDKHFLQRMKDMQSVIKAEGDISGILFKLGFMKFDSPFFSGMDVEKRFLLYSELMDVNDKNSVLDQVYNIDHSKFSQITIDEMKELQRFLQSGVTKSKDKKEYRRKLKSLPLFETIHGDRVRIDGPKEDVIFAEFFKKIGVKDQPTAEQYCNVLAGVYADSCDKPQPNLNQQQTVKRAVQQFFMLIKTQGNQLVVDDVETLYLPAVDGKLYPSDTLHYNDTTFETKRLEEALGNKFLLLEKLCECHLESDIYEHQRLLQLLPQKHKPKMLSQFTEEKVVESHMQLCEFGTDCEFSGWFNKHLSTERSLREK
ncbi:hypothetical protein FQN60_001433 [Etheostoma spectabile]|uniref:Sacsin/Nov domain-containing protein n=1 Tax=Etheostoma spectabile TaxID=54343 RepID=A0A5J5D438_9PERO|nr:hypothetical protein FQN60_001433 [Etheostoma spectabile]